MLSNRAEVGMNDTRQRPREVAPASPVIPAILELPGDVPMETDEQKPTNSDGPRVEDEI